MSERDGVDIILSDMDENNIDSVLKTYHDIKNIRKKIDEKEQMLKDKIKSHMKENKWNKYKSDGTGLSVSVTTQKMEKVNKESLKMLLNEEKYNQVVTKTSFEKMVITTPEDRKRLKKYATK